jgi:hypothetical protein
MATATVRKVSEVAAEIRREWKNVYFGAVPYLNAMATLETVHDCYGLDDGKGIVLYFLANASGFRGEAAKRLKAELKAMIK